MDSTTAVLVALGIGALLVIAFFSVFRNKGKFTVKTKLAEITAEGENAATRSQLETGRAETAGASTRVAAGATEIGQVGTGGSVFVAQHGASIIIQANERTKLTEAEQEKKATETQPREQGTVGDERKPTSSRLKIPVEEGVDSEGDTPPPTTMWVGRVEELQLMERPEVKVIAITGIGGQGKSTLAAKFLSNTKPKTEFQDWRDCKETSNTLHTQIVRAIERLTFGKRRASEISGESTASVVRLFLSLVANSNGIFVFDNIDQYVDVVQSRAVDVMQLLIDGALKDRGRARFVFKRLANSLAHAE